MPSPAARALLSLVAAAALACAGQGQALDVRVLVQQGGTVAVKLLGTESSPQAAPPSWTVSVRGGELTLNGRSAGSSTLYVPPSEGSLVQIGPRTYRGGVLLRAQGGQVQGINVLNVEDYLRGVVPAEMPDPVSYTHRTLPTICSV